ncbi:OmpH family outer membrane protein [Falsiporphyromonas endometrii]|uniref:OmpH family outer membrane protein n=1 Tax=Falsiporphyromonas endometrii TaxID=1387297 RepID=A0ABV9K5Q8_9PORP|nr:OmpH family outer membrane protein [Porphyromonadaceae bacterium]
MKKFILALLLLIPAVAFSQQKIAVVNTQEIMTQLPDFKAAQKQLEEKGKKYDEDYANMQKEIEKKSQAYIADKDKLNDVLKKTREQEIQDMLARLEQSKQLMAQDMQNEQEKLFAPIQKKIYDALKKVGDENGYAYIMESQIMHYQGPGAIDCTAKVKAKLGLK